MCSRGLGSRHTQQLCLYRLRNRIPEELTRVEDLDANQLTLVVQLDRDVGAYS